jgi:ABC-type branched-subunit amino acid transport system ATPase component
MLEIKGIHTFYGLSHILFDVSLAVHAGQVVCLLGRNGAGKTTTLKSVMGITPPRSGRIVFKGEDITGSAPYRMARKRWVKTLKLRPASPDPVTDGMKKKFTSFFRPWVTSPSAKAGC